MGYDDLLFIPRLSTFTCVVKDPTRILAGQPVYGNHMHTGVCSHSVVPFSLHVHRITAKSEP